ncbi:endonuclease/exonuclease/phosphatase family protein [Sulfitobacter guttiformis]|uniref:Endonuclease/exonuclease/phosphatase (EEP) superfamily protein YafD n=1 Tax=Sulfitobacter guttiformis TaxID=74349 RepID=A0A420DQV1_9RHOB|nr:endonuclease/exonuclease/phosphatase family protein [Sulfitobacter guttiformis]KIN74035.1 YD repeat protein [Sulfitobacter guttiformis KCTC 32187]RKE96656.1 endonuclease/exonuclease/phosphatase (EEP) superfamily protein YafD [Sulfitobacter guttiformis]
MTGYIDGILIGIAAILLIATALPLSKLPYGFTRGPDFFRLQMFWVGAVAAAIAAPLTSYYWLAPLLLAIALVQMLYVVKFTSLWWRQSVDADEALRADERVQISVLAANVKKSNRDFGALIGLIQQHQPDVVLAIEVDDNWISALEGALSGLYRHRINVPKDTGYGISVMSKLALSEPQVREVVTEGVPSIRTAVQLRNGARIRLYVVHPEPPVLTHDTVGRDSEIAHIGLEAADDPLPAIVSGDLNDVAWSTTTRRFQRMSGLLDPRVGRGFYNTFNAFHWWARWPLDHLFHDPKFRLVKVERLEKIGSDHFPMLFALAFTGIPAGEDTLPAEDIEETMEAKDMIADEKERIREPIGTDWED